MRYKDGILAAIAGLQDGGNKGSSRSAIQKYMQDSSFHYKCQWNNNAFLAALKKAVSDGDLIQIKNSYKLSVAMKKKLADTEKKQTKKKENAMKKLQSDASESNLSECMELLIEYMDEKGTIQKETVLSAFGSRLECLPKKLKYLIVPMSWNGQSSELLKGRDVAFRDALQATTNGTWAVYAVDVSLKQTVEGNPNIKTYGDYYDDGTIDQIYETSNATPVEADKKILDHLNLPWEADEWDASWTGYYQDSGEVWSEIESFERVKDDTGSDEIPVGYYLDGRYYEQDEETMEFDAHGDAPWYERVLSASFLVAVSKDLLLSSVEATEEEPVAPQYQKKYHALPRQPKSQHQQTIKAARILHSSKKMRAHPPLEGITATVDKWFPDKGFGFATNTYGHRYYIHSSEFTNVAAAGHMTENSILQFNARLEGKSLPRAIDIQILYDPSTRKQPQLATPTTPIAFTTELYPYLSQQQQSQQTAESPSGNDGGRDLPIADDSNESPVETQKKMPARVQTSVYTDFLPQFSKIVNCVRTPEEREILKNGLHNLHSELLSSRATRTGAVAAAARDPGRTLSMPQVSSSSRFPIPVASSITSFPGVDDQHI